MLMEFREKMRKNQKGFTLVELIIVMAILALLAGIAVPRYQNIRVSSAVKADAATATSIARACRIQETETGVKVTGLSGAAPALQAEYMTAGKPQSGGASAAFNLGGGGTAPYTVTWTPDDNHAPYNTLQTVTEGEAFSIQTKSTTGGGS